MPAISQRYGKRSVVRYRRDPLRADIMRMVAGVSASRAIENPKAVASRLGKHVNSIYAYMQGAASNPVYRFDELLDAVDRPEHLELHVRVRAEHRMTAGKSLEELRTEMRELVCKREPLAEYRQKLAQLEYLTSGQLDALIEASDEEAAIGIRIGALGRKIKQLEAEQP